MFRFFLSPLSSTQQAFITITTENNDTYTKAYYLSTDKSITLDNLSLLGSDQKDWYTFSLTKRHQVNINLTGDTTWKLFKASDMFPVEVTEYDVNNNILDKNDRVFFQNVSYLCDICCFPNGTKPNGPQCVDPHN